MNKNIVIRIAAAMLAFSVVFAAYGCKKGEDSKGNSVNQPNVENSTAIINYTSINEEGKGVDATKVAEIADKAINTVTVGSSLGDKLKDETSKQDFIDKKDDYQISDEKAEQIAEKPAQWSEFIYDVYIANPNSQMMSFAKLTSEANEDIIINTKLGCEYGIVPGNGTSVAISGLVNTSKYADAEALKAALADVKAKIVYTLIDQNKNQGVDDWNAVTTELFELDFSK